MVDFPPLRSLSGLIATVQQNLPDWMIISISSIEFSDGEHFHLKINDIFVPLNYDNPSEKLNDLIDHLHCYARYEVGSTIFDAATAFSHRDYINIKAELFHEILSNLADIPVAIFISKNYWYVDVSGSGSFFPLNATSASDFLDYVGDIVWGFRVY